MDLRKILKKAPSGPGVYFFINNKKKVLYIGKAANLKMRLRSYLRPGWKDEMIKEASKLTWEETSSDIEALIREARAIKTHRPKYNILFRDDKNYLYVAFSKDRFQRIYFTHQPFKKYYKPDTRREKQKRENEFIGPFTDAEAVKQALKLLRKGFPYCTCPSNRLHSRKCVNGEIGKCPGFCCSSIPRTKTDERRYANNIRAIKKILTGGSKVLTRDLENKMLKTSAERKYEEAQILRDKLYSLNRVFMHSPYIKKDVTEERERALRLLKDLLNLRTIPSRIEGYDISHIQGSARVGSMVTFEDGMPAKNEYRKFIIKFTSGINDTAMINETLTRRLKHGDWRLPDLFLIDGGKGQLSAARMAVRMAGLKTPVISLAKGEEKLYMRGKELPRPPAPLLNLLTNIRDEAHRFAVSFHRIRRSKDILPTSTK